MDIGSAVAGAESRGGGQHELLLDEAGLGMILGQLHQPLLQRAPEQVQSLGRLAQTTLSLQTSEISGFFFTFYLSFLHTNVLILLGKFGCCSSNISNEKGNTSSQFR